MLLYLFSPHQFISYIFLALWKYEAVKVCLFRREKAHCNVSNNNHRFHVFRRWNCASKIHRFYGKWVFRACFFLAVIECFCILMKDIQYWQRQSQQQLIFLQWEGAAIVCTGQHVLTPFCRNSFPEGQGWNICILKNSRLFSLLWPARPVLWLRAVPPNL